MFLEFQFTLMSIILFSLTCYLYLSYSSIRKQKFSVSKLLDHIILVSLGSIFFSAIYLFRNILLYKLQLLGNKPIHVPIIVICFLSFFLSFAVGVLFMQKPLFSVSKANFLIPLSLLLLGIFLPTHIFSYLFLFIVLLFIIIVSLFVQLVISRKLLKNNHIILYIIGGSFCLLLSTLFSHIMFPELFHELNLALMVFITFGIFVFFVRYFLLELEKRYEDLEKRDEIILEKNQKIEILAFTDDVTGIPNRIALEKDLLSSKDSIYLCMFNIVNFMGYNALLGFYRGNELLREIASLVSSVLPPDVFLYRYYSDKFILRFSNHSAAKTLQILLSVREVFQKNSFQGISLDAYFGLYLLEPLELGKEDSILDSTIHALELSSSFAKRKKEQIYFYHKSDTSQFNHEMNLELNLKNAILHQEFLVYYQPQILLETREVTSFEALIRWNCNGTFISPSEFIPVSERKGLMKPLTRQVVLQVLKDIKEHLFFENKKVSINLSVDQLMDDSFVPFIEGACSQHKIKPSQIILEITETSLFNDIEKVNNSLWKLKRLGFQISLDDFGSGYSSMYRFAKLDIDEIKFDKVFSDDLQNEKVFNALLKSAELFQSFDMRIVIEGIETKEQLDAISSLPVDIVQGYYFYKPLSVEELENIF